MEFDENIDLSKRKFTSRLIVERARARGWKVVGFKTNPAIFQLNIPNKKSPINIFSASPPQMSYSASKIAKDKFITNKILKRANLLVPDELLISSLNTVNKKVLKDFLELHDKVVVKPLDASHGKGITTDITNLVQLTNAIKIASKHTSKSFILVQEQVEGIDIRVLCINYQFVDSISRIPAFVIGDGKNTVKKLIEVTNQHPDRGENYKTRLNRIPLDKAEAYIGSERFASVPKRDEIVQVIGVSNIGMGGERQNIKYDMPVFLKQLAEKVAETLELPVCGVDFMVKKSPKTTDTVQDLQPKVIEVNECPMLTMYDDLNSPEQHEVIDRYLDFVANS